MAQTPRLAVHKQKKLPHTSHLARESDLLIFAFCSSRWLEGLSRCVLLWMSHKARITEEEGGSAGTHGAMPAVHVR